MINFIGNLLVLAFISIIAWWFYIASSSSENFMRLQPIFNEIQADCQKNPECPSEEQFNEKVQDANFSMQGLKYYRGQYVLPSSNIVASGNTYFFITYNPVTDISYETSGGKNVELVLWQSTDATKNKRLN